MPNSLYLADAPPLVAGPQDDEFADASGTIPNGWTEYDVDAELIPIEDEAGLNLKQDGSNGNIKLTGIYKAIPAGDFTLWTRLSLTSISGQNLARAGIVLWVDPTDANADARSIMVNQNAANVVIQVLAHTSNVADPTVVAEALYTVSSGHAAIYLRVRRTSSTYGFDFSSDGIGWQRLHSTGILGITPTQVGLGVDNLVNGAVNIAARFSFWRSLASDVGQGGVVLGDRIRFQGGGGTGPPGGGGGRNPPGGKPPPGGGGSLTGPVLKKLRFPDKVI